MIKTFTERWTSDVAFSIDARLLHTETSPYQDIAVYDSKTFGRFLILDGLMMVTERDEFAYHDMIAHIPMAVHPDVRRVLIIGGGDGGTAREICRYRHIEHIDMVEIDERVVRVAKTYLPTISHVLENDPRLHLHFEDGATFIANQNPASYDLILVDSTDPIGPGEGLFTTLFYQHCHRILSADGILVNQHESPVFEPFRTEMIRAHRKLHAIFEHVSVYHFHQTVYPSGYWLFGFASKTYDPIRDHDPKRWESYGLSTKYYNSSLHPAAFQLPTYVKEALKP